MRIRINEEKFIALSEILLILYLCLPITISLLSSRAIHALVFLAALLFVAGLMSHRKWRYLVEFTVLFLVAFLLWFVVWRHQLDSLSYIYFCFASLSFAYGGIIIYQSKDLPMKRRLFIFLTMIVVVTAITSIMGLRIYPYAAREMARGSTYDPTLNFEVYKTIYRQMNIASWGQIYGMLFFIPGICIIWKKSKKLYWLIAILVIWIAIVSSQITFAVILSVALVVGVLTIGNNNKKTIPLIMILLIAAIFILLNLEGTLTWIVNCSDKLGFDFLTNKLNDLKQLLLYKQVVGDASSRSDLYMASINSFLESPIVGQLFNSNVTQADIGRHSELFDIMGATGLIGFVPVSIALARYYSFLNKIDPMYRKEMKIVFLGFIILFIINPVLSSPPIFVGAFLYSLLCVEISRHGLREKIQNN